MHVSTQAPAYARSEIFIHAPAALVWKLLTDFSGWKEWNPDIQTMDFSGPFVRGAHFYWKTGGVRIHSTLEEVDGEQRIAWSGKALGTKAQHAWVLTSNGLTTKVESEESFEGWLVRLMPRTMQKTLEQGLARQLSYLKMAAEHRQSQQDT